MCQHCCRLEKKPIWPTTHSCPLCPVRKVARQCRVPNRGEHQREYHYPTKLTNRLPVRQTKLCQDLSEFYSNVVADKGNVKGLRCRKRRQNIVISPVIQRCAGGTVGPVKLPKLKSQQTVRFATMNSLGIDSQKYLDKNVPLLQREKTVENGTWTWATATHPKTDKVLAVPARMATLFGYKKRPKFSPSSLLNITQASSSNPVRIR